MKKCPYCAEMIQDEAIKCRYCHSDLTVAPPTSSGSDVASASSEPSPAAVAAVTAEPDPAPAPGSPSDPGGDTVAELATASEEPAPTDEPIETSNVRYTHSGFRYVLGYGADFFGIWDRQSPSVPAERFPRTDDGWRQAWLRFAALEPDHTTVPSEGGSAPAAAAAPTSNPGTVAMDPSDTAAVQYTHSGTRYLLGYGKTFFGIWDRQAPNLPVERFARDDAGWAAAWRRYTEMEPNFAEVKLG